MKLRTGLFRIWLLATVTWFVYVLISEVSGISEWVGSELALIESKRDTSTRSPTKSDLLAFQEACREAQSSACGNAFPLLDEPDVYDSILDKTYPPTLSQECASSPQFAAAFVNAAVAHGLPTDGKGTPGLQCRGMLSLHIPVINWVKVVTAVGVPLIPLMLYGCLAWIIRGFRTPTKP